MIPAITVDSLIFMSIEVRVLGTSDICVVLIWGFLRLAFYFRIQALYFVTLRSLA